MRSGTPESCAVRPPITKWAEPHACSLQDFRVRGRAAYVRAPRCAKLCVQLGVEIDLDDGLCGRSDVLANCLRESTGATDDHVVSN